ncbi:MAG: hypothetical protein JOY71_24280 [Acetobacteraceae bacterium]|nr:hypothetical protein [Acetobacteraceae bacterium]
MIAVLLFVAGLGAGPAFAWTQVSSQDLAAACHSTEAPKRAFCLGYVSGIYDLQFVLNPPAGICPPANFNPDLLAEVVTAYLDTHEEGPATTAIGQAIVRFFPCPAGAQRR